VLSVVDAGDFLAVAVRLAGRPVGPLDLRQADEAFAGAGPTRAVVDRTGATRVEDLTASDPARNVRPTAELGVMIIHGLAGT
jgi:hypothetical protein